VLLKLVIVGGVSLILSMAYTMFQSFQGVYRKDEAFKRSLLFTGVVVLLAVALFNLV